jgi:hypothetical protein
MRYAHGYTMFAPAQLLLNWREQRPGNHDDLDSSVSRDSGRAYYMGADLLLMSLLYIIARLLCYILNDTSFVSRTRVRRLYQN